MKAVIYKNYGTPDNLEFTDMNKPTPKAGELLIKVIATTVTPADCFYLSASMWAIRLNNGLFKPKNTLLGCELVGIVEAVGTGVENFKVDDQIIATCNGCYCEYICISEQRIISIKPPSLSIHEAASFCYAGLTALPFLRDMAKIKAGQKILIIGASGSIGTLAVQLAKYYGAEVTAVCSSKNVDLVKSLGADHVIDYKKQNFVKMNQCYDVVFDVVFKSSFSQCKKILVKNGLYMTTKPSVGILITMLWTKMFNGKKAVFFPAGMRPVADKVADLKHLTTLFEAGVYKIIIDRAYPLEQIVNAFRYVGQGHKVGNVIIEVAKV